MVQVKAYVGDREVIHSGVLHITEDNAKLLIDGLPINIRFFSDSQGVRWAREGREEGVDLNLFNFGNPLGEGKLDSVSIAESDGRTIYLSFYVQSITVNNGFHRAMTYTLMLGENGNG